VCVCVCVCVKTLTVILLSVYSEKAILITSCSVFQFYVSSIGLVLRFLLPFVSALCGYGDVCKWVSVKISK